MSANIMYFIWALVAGSMMSCQSLVNAQLSAVTHGPIWAALISFSVGTILLATIAFSVSGGKLPVLDTAQLQWWMFAGGIMGAFFVTTSIILVPKLGVSAMIALFIAGQLTFALILDHFGVLAAVAHPVTLKKLLGVAFLFIGALLTQNFK